jgi:capsid protein
MGFFETDPQHSDGFECAEGARETVRSTSSPGSMEAAAAGQEVRSVGSTASEHGVQGISAAVLRSIAVGGGVAYTTLTGDLTGVNYSSIRAGLL